MLSTLPMPGIGKRMKNYIDDSIAGKSGPRGIDFNMRWVASGC